MKTYIEIILHQYKSKHGPMTDMIYTPPRNFKIVLTYDSLTSKAYCCCTKFTYSRPRATH